MRDIWWIDPEEALDSGCHPAAHQTLKTSSTRPRIPWEIFPSSPCSFLCWQLMLQFWEMLRARNVAPETWVGLNRCDLSAKLEQVPEGSGTGDWVLVWNRVTHVNTGLSSWKDFLLVSKGQDRHVVVVRDKNVLLPGCEVTAGLNFWLRGEKHKGGEYWEMHFRSRGILLSNSRATLPQKHLTGRRVDGCQNHWSSWYSLWS